MTKPKSDPNAEPRRCDVCDRPLRYGNKSGICSGTGSTSACKHERMNRDRIAAGLPPYELKTELIGVRAGETCNSWTVLEDGVGVLTKVRCRCECGTERSVLIAALTEGRSKSCGRKCQARRIGNPYLMPGIYGNLEVLETGLRSKDLVRIHCNRCGGDTTKQAFLIKRGISASCGCGRGKWTHGLSQHPLYSTWNSAVDRCTNPSATGYEGYGGQGIKVCDRWMDPAAFIEDILREIGPRPEGRYPDGRPIYTLDRIDVEGNYESGNVRWADKKTQSENRRSVNDLASRERAALAEVERLNRLLESRPRKRRPRTVAISQDVLF